MASERPASPSTRLKDEYATFQFRGLPRDIPGCQPSLPPEKVFSIQSGSELFRLSGASLTSDSPSYFTKFFEEQISLCGDEGSVKTLYIDRDPTIFHDIARHLQGYHIRPLDGGHYVRLFADAQFYSLPRLISQLFSSETFIQIGDRHFQVPRDIFSSPGDTPNFFTLGFAAFFSSPQEVFPGLDRTRLLRPPPIQPPTVPSRSADVFAQLLHLLRGYPLRVQNEEHRKELLRDCRYFHLRGLEQKLIAHEISYNVELQSSEILIRLADVKPANLSYPPESSRQRSGFWIRYQRPYVDTASHILTLEIGANDDEGGDDNSSISLDFTTHQASLNGRNRVKFAAMLQSLQTQKPPPCAPAPHSDKIRFQISLAFTDTTLDNRKVSPVRTNKPGAVEAKPAIIATNTTPTASKKRKVDLHPSTPSSRNSGDTIPDDARIDLSNAIPCSNINNLNTAQPPPPSSKMMLNPLPTVNPHTPRARSIVRTGQWRLRAQPVAGNNTSTTTSAPPTPAGAVDPSQPQPQPQSQYQHQDQQTSVQEMEIILVGVKLDILTNERARNARRGFLR